jgi:hypothetical protein
LPIDSSLISGADEFSQMASQMERLLALDVDNSDITSLPGADHIVVKMADLFKLTLTPGNPLHERNARRSLREEEELYEIVPDRIYLSPCIYAPPVTYWLCGVLIILVQFGDAPMMLA